MKRELRRQAEKECDCVVFVFLRVGDIAADFKRLAGRVSLQLTPREGTNNEVVEGVGHKFK